MEGETGRNPPTQSPLFYYLHLAAQPIMALPLLSVRMQARQHTCTHTHPRYTERLSAWELHAVFKQIIKGKVMRSRGGHSWGYSSECVHYCRREWPRWGNTKPHCGLMRTAGFPQTHFRARVGKLLRHGCARFRQSIRVDVHISAFLTRCCQLAYKGNSWCLAARRTCAEARVFADAICISLGDSHHNEALCRLE